MPILQTRGTAIGDAQMPKKGKMVEGSDCDYYSPNGKLAMELQRRIYLFRDIVDLPEFETASMMKLVTETMKDLHRLYPENEPEIRFTEMRQPGSTEVKSKKALVWFCATLKSVGDSWKIKDGWLDEATCDEVADMKDQDLDEIVGTALKTLNALIKLTEERFDMMDEDDRDQSPRLSTFKKILDSPLDYKNTGQSPDTPTSVLPGSNRNDGGFVEASYKPPLLLRLRVRSVRKLNPVDVKHFFSAPSVPISMTLAINTTSPPPETKKNAQPQLPPPARIHSPSIQVPSPTPPPPPPPARIHSPSIQVPPPTPPPTPTLACSPSVGVPPPTLWPQTSRGPGPPLPPPLPGAGSTGLAPPPPPPPGMGGPAPSLLPGAKGAPPPPPLGSAKSLRAKKASTKLKRSTQIGNLYRLLKGKVEGSNASGKLGGGRKGPVSAPAGGKQGMADALAEMTKRSAYFQKILEDVEKHGKEILQLKGTLNSFKNKDMKELKEFHSRVESILEHLTDESQVLARFEEFPTKKLENLRMASALYAKLDGIINELHNFEIVAPVGQVLDRVERYFNKIKGEMDALDRVKDEESKKFSSYGIQFDFDVLLRIKEAMVDVSSGIMELALAERREAKEIQNKEATAKAEGRAKVCIKMLWRAFQFAFRVYSFAGGHDDRADELTRELAQEIESHPH